MPSIGALIAKAVWPREVERKVEQPVMQAAERALRAGDRLALTPRVTLQNADVAALDQALEALASMTAETKAQLAARYAPVYADQDLQARAGKGIAGWVWGGKGKVAMIAAYAKAGVAGQPAESELERLVVELAATRQARWRRLAAAEGLPMPEAFHLFRGVNGEYAVEAVVKAWSDPTARTMAVPTHELASWSLDRGIAKAFGDSAAASVIYEADVPFGKTLLDKWVDGGPLVTMGLEQQEVGR